MDKERYVSYKFEDLWPEWQSQAHCQGTGVSNYFGDDEQQPTMSIKQVRNAAKLCDVCPVFKECLRHALVKREEYGVWAGTSGRTRKRLFAMLDTGEIDLETLIEVTASGRGRGEQEPRSLRSDDARGDRVSDAPARSAHG